MRNFCDTVLFPSVDRILNWIALLAVLFFWFQDYSKNDSVSISAGKLFTSLVGWRWIPIQPLNPNHMIGSILYWLVFIIGLIFVYMLWKRTREESKSSRNKQEELSEDTKAIIAAIKGKEDDWG
jgi:hypothetical protein